MINAPEFIPGHWPETPVSLLGFSNCLLLGDGKVLTWTLQSYVLLKHRLVFKDEMVRRRLCWDVVTKGQSSTYSERRRKKERANLFLQYVNTVLKQTQHFLQLLSHSKSPQAFITDVWIKDKLTFYIQLDFKNSIHYHTVDSRCRYANCRCCSTTLEKSPLYQLIKSVEDAFSNFLSSETLLAGYSSLLLVWMMVQFGTPCTVIISRSEAL